MNAGRHVPIQGITFDFWRTLFYAYSNYKERKRVRVEALADLTSISEERATEAIDHMSRAYLMVHVNEQRTYGPEAAAPIIAEFLQLELSNEETELLTTTFADAILEYPPEPLEEALEAVRAAAEHVPVGIISDTGLVPGRCLDVLLERHGIARHLTVRSYSDAVGVAKPQSAIFHHAAQGLGVETNQLLHIGDLEPTDVAGAQKVGAAAALFAGDNDRFLEKTAADYTFTQWREFILTLPKILDRF